MKDSQKRMKRQATDWGKVSVNHISDKGLESRQIGNCQRLHLEESISIKRNFFGVIEQFCILIVMVVTQISTYDNFIELYTKNK